MIDAKPGDAERLDSLYAQLAEREGVTVAGFTEASNWMRETLGDVENERIAYGSVGIARSLAQILDARDATIADLREQVAQSEGMLVALNESLSKAGQLYRDAVDLGQRHFDRAAKAEEEIAQVSAANTRVASLGRVMERERDKALARATKAEEEVERLKEQLAASECVLEDEEAGALESVALIQFQRAEIERLRAAIAQEALWHDSQSHAQAHVHAGRAEALRALASPQPDAAPCNWIGGNDGAWCTTCNTETKTREAIPSCPLSVAQPDAAKPHDCIGHEIIAPQPDAPGKDTTYQPGWFARDVRLATERLSRMRHPPQPDAAKPDEVEQEWKKRNRRDAIRRATGNAPSAVAPQPSGEAWLAWAEQMFGLIARDPIERGMRFVEEAVELAQSSGINADTLARIVERVYSRPAGMIAQEIGQCMATLECLAVVFGVDPVRERDIEFDRVRAIPKEEWTRRHAAKIARGFALPAPPALDQEGEG